MRRFILVFSFIAVLLGCSNCGPGKTAATDKVPSSAEKSTVYFTSEITPESLVKIYDALGVEAFGRVAVKISTGESPESNHLRPEFIENLVKKVGGTLVECNTAYGGSRSTTEKHLEAIAERGYDKIATVDIMDSEGEMNIPVSDSDGHPAAPEMKDIGILASKDPVALDKACLDLVFSHKDSAGDDAKALQQRINSRHGTHIVDYAASIGLGNLGYEIVNIDL